MNCIVCSKDQHPAGSVWCTSCVTTTINRHVALWEAQERRVQLLADAMRKVLSELETIDDNALGMKVESGGLEWPLKMELELRLRNALEEVGR